MRTIKVYVGSLDEYTAKVRDCRDKLITAGLEARVYGTAQTNGFAWDNHPYVHDVAFVVDGVTYGPAPVSERLAALAKFVKAASTPTR